MKELYGVGVLFFYFLKWPIVIAYLYLRLNGLEENYIMDALWLYCVFLILKDFWKLLQKRKSHSTSK